MSKYAKTTTVPIEQSKMEMDRVLTRYGATKVIFADDKKTFDITVYAEMEPNNQRRMLKFYMPGPDNSCYSRSSRLTKEEQRRREAMRRWRVLILQVKASFETLESGQDNFDEVFLRHLVLPDGYTVGEWLIPQIDDIYAKGIVPDITVRLLPAKTEE